MKVLERLKHLYRQYFVRFVIVVILSFLLAAPLCYSGSFSGAYKHLESCSLSDIAEFFGFGGEGGGGIFSDGEASCDFDASEGAGSKNFSAASDFLDEDEHFQPRMARELQILENIGYQAGFSNSLRIPLWVGYVAGFPFKYEASERSKFRKDPRAVGSASPSDYSKSGYDRGHMAPNYAVGRCYGPEAQSETFYMTNIIPQTPKLNRQTWRELEMRIANDIARKYETARVFVGPILSAPTRFMKNKIAVPVSCYAAIVVCDKANGRLYGLGFIIPQNPAENSIWDYCVAIDEIEELTGIDFFHQLPDDIENEIEANADPSAFKD